MTLFEWFRERIGKRVHLHIAGVTPQTWRIYSAGSEFAVLVQPAATKTLDQLTVFYAGITRYADASGAGKPGDVVGGEWNPETHEWRRITRLELRDEPTWSAETGPAVPDHLPDDVG